MPVGGLVLLAALVGLVAWSGVFLGLLVLPVFVWAWARCESRWAAALVGVAYYAAAGRGLIRGGAVFFADPGAGELSLWSGLGIWLLPSLVLGGVWGLCWSARGGIWRVVGCVVALLVVGLPPIGLIGWTSPVTAAGAYFPGLGWCGLLLMVAVFGCVVVGWQARRVLAGLAVVSVVAWVYADTRGAMSGWVGVDTAVGQPNDLTSPGRVAGVMHDRLSVSKAQFALLPETVAGDWTFSEQYWQGEGMGLARAGRGAWVGALVPLSGGGYRNALVGVGALAGVNYLQRVPVPLSMWRPWDKKQHVSADWFGTGVVALGGRTVAVLVCYETLLAWPAIMSAAQGATDLAWVANDWWARGTSIPAIQRVSTQAWASLWGWSEVSAVNL